MKAPEPGPSPESLENLAAVNKIALAVSLRFGVSSIAVREVIAPLLDEAVRDTKERCAQVADFCAKEHPGHHGNCIASEIREV